MALVERLMHLDADPARDMAVHTFFAALSELIAGRLTVAQIKTYYAMDTADEAEMDIIVANAPGTAAGRALYLHELHGMFILAEDRAPGYDTPAAVRTKFNL